MSSGEDIFDDIAQFVPNERRAPYWRAVSKLRCLPSDDEVVLLVKAMGIHTFILRDLPTSLLQERETLVQRLKENQDEFSRLASVAKNQTIEAVNETERVAVELTIIQEAMRSLAKDLQEAGVLAANRVDVDTLSRRLTAELEERTIKPHAKLFEQTLQSIEKIDSATASAQRTIDVWSKVHLKGVWLTAFVVVFCFCGLVLFLAWRAMDRHYDAVLDYRLEQLTDNLQHNKAVLADLATANVVLTTGVPYNGERPDHGSRYLMLQPATGARFIDDEDRSKAGVIFFKAR